MGFQLCPGNVASVSSGILRALTLLLPRIEQLLLLHRALWQLRQRTEKLLSTVDLIGHCTCLCQLRLRPWALLVRGLLNSSRIWARGSHYKLVTHSAVHTWSSVCLWQFKEAMRLPSWELPVWWPDYFCFFSVFLLLFLCCNYYY